eukprot:UN30119
MEGNPHRQSLASEDGASRNASPHKNREPLTFGIIPDDGNSSCSDLESGTDWVSANHFFGSGTASDERRKSDQWFQTIECPNFREMSKVQEEQLSEDECDEYWSTRYNQLTTQKKKEQIALNNSKYIQKPKRTVRKNN